MLEIIDIALGTSHCRVNLKSDDGMKIAEIPESLAAELGLVPHHFGERMGRYSGG